MIIMINGAFGVGKTTIANELQKKLKNSMVYDPEEIGYMLRNIVPEEIQSREAETGDFQDFHLWKELTVEVAKRIVTKYTVDLIVPMTIHKIEYLQYIRNGFKDIDEETYHFCLTANKETIHKRLSERGEKEGNWCFQQTEKCLVAYREINFGEYIDTERVSVNIIIDKIKEKLSLS
ncbi:AAA family ATPase [Bacillus alkalicellulosilyticus]|uniref:AAA family ATPase n=1 Tax=Alkalihalobacterium alkalicellulosilyticum TaxID=1912214 RepID=UPI0009989547|nr:AAA family ATPase [Bacillus alkalicellulosilyticus]